INQYPHEMSGGMKQRVMIAMAIACEPALLIADEPTTALDVTVQAQILDLIGQLQQDMKMAVMLITHNLGIVAQHADRVTVMYAGRIAESAPVNDLFANPCHPYTQGLLKSIPRSGGSETRLYSIEGTVPSADQYPVGCRFSNRCPVVMDQCRQSMPAMIQRQDNHFAACWQEQSQSVNP
ncbi:MAG: ABC transporter ATP-binding protein, partial [Gammaproteobacteria bacterium]|nr:ABC transporter ATP-binding protein [Gammaproteobacteria bacterium]